MEDNKVIKKGISNIGFRYVIFAIVVIVIQLVGSLIVKRLLPDLSDRQNSSLSFLFVIISMYLIGFPLIYLITKKFEKIQIEKKRLGFGKFVAGIFMCAGFCGVGAFVGVILNALFTIPFGANMNDTTITALMMDSSPFLRILVAGILAPIFEELIFRKVLVDHLAKYGKVVAIVASGLMFGMFHGNFAQCFFAAMLGFFFAYVYLKTGNILYTIAYHMIINCTTSVITYTLATRLLAVYTAENIAALSAGDPEAIMAFLPPILMYFAWLVFLIMCVIAGIIIFFINIKKFNVNENVDAMSKGKSIVAVITNPGMIVFFLICAGLFLQSYLPGIIEFFVR